MDHIPKILVRYCRKQQRDGIVFLEIFYCLHKLGDPVLIMGSVYDHPGKYGFHPSLPTGVFHSPDQSFFFQMMFIFQDSHSLQSQSPVHHLISGDKRNKQLCLPVYSGIRNKTDPFRSIILQFLFFLLHFIPGTSQAFRSGFDHIRCFLIIAVKDHRHSRFDDPCLFSRDLRDRVAQIFYMIQTDRGDHTDQRIPYRVGGIQSSSQSGFQHNIIYLFFLKDQHTHQKQKFKIGRMVFSFFHQRICQFLHTTESLQKNFVRDHHFIDLKAFIDLYQMRGCKQTAFITAFLQHSRYKSADTAFSIGPRHMDDLLSCVRTSQQIQALSGMFQFIFRCKFRYIFNILNRFFISEQAVSLLFYRNGNFSSFRSPCSYRSVFLKHSPTGLQTARLSLL